jgi:hypothetical protein
MQQTPVSSSSSGKKNNFYYDVSSGLQDLILKTQNSRSTELPVYENKEEGKFQMEQIYIIGSRIFLGKNKILGRCANINYSKKFCFTLRCSLYEAYLVAKDAFAQCTTEHNSSNSPSMMMHQLASLTFGCALKAHVQWEETSGSYTPDLLVTMKEQQIYIDITGDNVLSKLESMPNDIPKIVLNKYVILDFDTPLLNMLRKWSIANDKCDTSFLYKSILEQSSGLPMLYSKRVLDFFCNRGNPVDISIHSDLALKSLLTVFDETCSESKSLLSHDALNECFRTRMSKLFEDLPKDTEFENDYFLFPRLDPSNTEPLRDEDLKHPEDPAYFIRDGFLDYGMPNITDSHKLFEPRYNMKVTNKAYLSLMDYPKEKNEKKLQLQFYFQRLTRTLGYQTAAWRQMLEERVFEKIGINIVNPFKSHLSHISKGFEAQPKENNPFDITTCFLNFMEIDIDPDHLLFLQQRSMTSLASTLRLLRDYHDLRFRNRVSVAISINKKPEKCFCVKHWKFDNLYALVKIKGLIYEKDKGVVYVSYFNRGSLLRTEKWRLADVEAYTVGHHRLVLILAAFRANTGRDPTIYETSLYARIISENSWGLSRFLKVYRYVSSGLCMSSTEMVDSLTKLEKTVDSPVKSKLSYRMIIRKLISKSSRHELEYGKTPIFSLKFKDIGWESFLLNLCPSSTYGKFRHLQKTITELSQEIELFDLSFLKIKNLYLDFERIIELPQENLQMEYYKHFKKVVQLSKETDGRFTFSPASALTLYNEMRKSKINFKGMQGSVPPLSELMTAKASTDRRGKGMLAVESISKLSQEYQCTSTSLLNLKILDKTQQDKKVDLTMRVFDKDQIGGDREISILTSEFRILQVVTEKFFEKWAKFISIDKLHDKDKTYDFISSYEQSIKGFHSVCLTADQTRWGPNFNTCIFGFCSLMISTLTTESYLPALICFLSEFKIFEMPCWIPSLFNLSNAFYSIPGLLARNHMGQGIFHQSSSLYHSYVISILKSVIKSNYKPWNHSFDVNKIVYEADAFVTSDDVAIISYFKTVNEFPEGDKKELEYVPQLTKYHFSNCYNFFVLYGIKTSNYKNIVSNNVEFNSIHLGDRNIGNTDLKFCYSLIDPATTGNFLNDFDNVYDSYVTSRNSLCSHITACLISNMLLIKFSRQWKLDFSLIGFPRDNDLISGIPKLYTIKPDGLPNFYLNTESCLRYKTRKALNQRIDTGNKILDTYARAALMRIQGTRQRTSYRSVLTHSVSDKIMLASDYFSFSDSIGETYLNFVRETVRDVEHISMIVNREYQTTFSSYPEEHESHKGFFKFLKFRDPVKIKVDMSDLVASHFPPEKYLSLDPDRIQFHMLRKRRTLWIEEPLLDYKTTSFVEALAVCEERIREIEMSSTSCVVLNVTETEDEIKYIQHVFYPPETLKFMKRNVSFKACSDTRPLENNVRYFPSRTQEPLRLHFSSSQKIELYRESVGRILPNVKLDMIEVPEIDYENIASYDFTYMMQNESKYRERAGEKVFLNISLDKNKIPQKLTSVDEKSDISSSLINVSKSIDEMMLDLLDLKVEGLDELNLEVDRVDEEKDEEIDIDQQQVIANEASDMLSRVIFTELRTISIEIDRSLGFLCNSSWSTNIIILESLLAEMEKRGALYFQTRRDSIFNWKEVVCYTFERAFRSKIETLISSSKMNIRQNNIDKTRQSIRDSLYRIINGGATNLDFLLFLLNGFSNISFTNVAMGELTDLERFLECLRNY